MSTASFTAASRCNATIVSRRDVAEDRAIIRVRPDSEIPSFEPGQFITVGLPRPVEGEIGADVRPAIIRRAYSIASAPGDAELEFFVVLIDAGRLTPHLWPLRAGGRLWMDNRCHGELTLRDVPAGVDLLLLATGTGIAPYVSMLRANAMKKRWRRLVLFHGVRTLGDAGYVDVMREQERADPSIAYVPVISRCEGPPPAGCRTGHVQQAFEPGVSESLGFRLNPADSHVFLCGNPAMVKSGQELLLQRGFAMHSRRRGDGNVHAERYW
ncbi:Ferredoxin--NADP reductase [Phycisphaerae bacterium RAS1]|nr:Ferredoxin--NADP reductase [Phycisphaerae bacterium RAS1]